MRVLITGSAGFVGSHLVDHLLASTDWEIIGIDSFKHRGDSLRVQKDGRYKIFCHDLNAPASDRLVQKIGEIDYFINMASESHVDRSIEDPVTFVQNNVNLCLYSTELAMNLGVKKFVQISTDEVYGAAFGKQLHKEWSTILPSNPYSASKAAQEAITISFWRTYGLPLIITNTMNMFGERQDAEKYIPKIISRVLSGDTLQIHGNKEAIGSRYYLHARNFADALLFLMQNVTPTMYRDSDQLILPDRFNVVGEIEMNNLEVAQMVAGMLGKELRFDLVDFHKARPGHDRRYALDGAKIRELGWVQPLNLYDSISRVIDWTLSNKEWLEKNG